MPLTAKELEEYFLLDSLNLDKSLLDVFPMINKGWVKPVHLMPIIELVCRAHRGEPIRACVSVPPRHGKFLEDTTPILTARGWVTVGDVVSGDKVVGADGNWTTVLATYKHKNKDHYKVTFSDGASIIAGGEHQWEVSGRYTPNKKYVKNTEWLKDRLYEADGRKRYKIPVMRPWIGVDTPLPIDPYILGCWLGDGTSANGHVTSMDEPIIDVFKELGWSPIAACRKSKATTYRTTLAPELRKLGLLKNKHIPEIYLNSTPENRLALLQGLCDTDGTVAKNGSQQSFCSTNEKLVVGFKFLVTSLGGTYTAYKKNLSPRYKDAYNIYFRLPHGMAGFRLKRKQDLLAKESPRNTPRRFISSIEYVGKRDGTCFTVDAQDHLYCAGKDMIVSHNTELILQTMAWWLMRRPQDTHAYVSYASDFAQSKSRLCQTYAKDLGVQLATESVKEWRTQKNGGLLATGIGGPLTGHGISGLLIVDDPHKNREAAESAVMRQQVHEWFTSTAMTRLEPGASAIIVHTRWHPDDLIGRLTSDESEVDWEYVNLPAISNAGEPLWPDRWNLEELGKRRMEVGPYDWASMYMGQPQPKEGRLFNDPLRYDFPDFDNARLVIGVDPAATGSSRADHSAAVVLAVRGYGDDVRADVVDVLRVRCEIPELVQELRRLQAKWAAPMAIEAVGGFKAVPQMLRSIDPSLRIVEINPTKDKFTRAMSVASAWNTGRVRVPKQAEWLKHFIDEVTHFTGVSDASDDQVDAMTHAWNTALALVNTKSIGPKKKRVALKRPKYVAFG